MENRIQSFSYALALARSLSPDSPIGEWFASSVVPIEVKTGPTALFTCDGV